MKGSNRRRAVTHKGKGRRKNRLSLGGRGKKLGMVLIIVLVVVAMLALGAYTYADLMRTHHESTQLASRQLETKMIVDSGVDYLRIVLRRPDQAQAEAGGLYDAPQQF